MALICLWMALGGASGSTTLAFAQPAAQPPAATDEFVPITELPPTEQLPAAPLVVAAYAFIWLAVLVYVTLLWRRLAAVQKDLDALRRRSK
jgi:CcmD family protein